MKRTMRPADPLVSYLCDCGKRWALPRGFIIDHQKQIMGKVQVKSHGKVFYRTEVVRKSSIHCNCGRIFEYPSKTIGEVRDGYGDAWNSQDWGV